MDKKYRFIFLFFVLILLLVPIGFRRYFAALLTGDNQSWTLHFHLMVMTLWCLMLIAQPILIAKKKSKIHKMIGRASWVLVPIILVSIWLVIRHSFFRMGAHLSIEQNMQQVFFPFSQMLLFGAFYLLAILNTHNPRIHMRYIIVSSVSLLGPTVGRINFSSVGLGSLDMDLWIMNLFLIGFIVYDLVNRKQYLPYYVGLGAYALMHWGYYSFSGMEVWQFVGRKLLYL